MYPDDKNKSELNEFGVPKNALLEYAQGLAGAKYEFIQETHVGKEKDMAENLAENSKYSSDEIETANRYNMAVAKVTKADVDKYQQEKAKEEKELQEAKQAALAALIGAGTAVATGSPSAGAFIFGAFSEKNKNSGPGRFFGC